MTLLVAAVIIVGCLCLLDLLLTFGLLRRLREHAELLAGGAPAPPPPGLTTGERPAAFTAVSTSGQSLTGPAGLRMAAFFSPSCSVCPGKVAPFVSYVRSLDMDPENVLAVVAGQGAAPYLADLSQVAHVCVEPAGGDVALAFAVHGFPAFFLLDPAGRIVTAGYDPDSLPEPAPV